MGMCTETESSIYIYIEIISKLKQSSNIVEYWEKGAGEGVGGWRERDGRLTALKEQYRHLPEIEVDEVARLVGDVRSEIPTDDAVPCRVVFLVEFLLDVRGDVL